MLIGKASDISSSEITPEEIYRQRRRFLGRVARLLRALDWGCRRQSVRQACNQTTTLRPEKIVTQYNNFYEFGTDKSDPMRTRAR
jgi:sulfoxide reductase catalytic subunit YedY